MIRDAKLLLTWSIAETKYVQNAGAEVISKTPIGAMIAGAICTETLVSISSILYALIATWF